MTDTVLPQGDDPKAAHRGWTRPSLPGRAVVAIAVAIVLVAAGAGYELSRGHSTPKPAAPSVASDLHQVLANALRQGSVHMISRSTSPKVSKAVFDDHDTTTGGIQQIQVDGGHAAVRVVGATSYFTADRVGLTRYLGFSAQQARMVRGRWLSIAAGQPGYSSVTNGVTLASALSEIGLTGELRRVPASTKDGQRVFGIQGRPPGPSVPSTATATLWVSVGPTELPVEYDASGDGTTVVVRCTKWGDPVTVVAPHNVVAASALLG
jgi:hypothetical protein